MPIDGKVAGAAVGGLLGGPWGALIGGMLGHATADSGPSVSPETQQKRGLVVYLAVFMDAIARSDGVYSPKEKLNAQRMLAHINKVIGAHFQPKEITHLVDNAQSITNISLQNILDSGKKDESFRWMLIKIAWRMAACDEGVSLVEKKWIDGAAAAMGCNPRDLEHSGLPYYRPPFGEADREKAAKDLGVTASATFDEAQNAYRTLVKKYHPDLYKNLPQEFQQVASDKLVVLNHAFEAFRRTDASDGLNGIVVSENVIRPVKPNETIRCMVCAKIFQLDNDPVPSPTLRCTDCQTLLLHPLSYAEHLVKIHHNQAAPLV